MLICKKFVQAIKSIMYVKLLVGRHNIDRMILNTGLVLKIGLITSVQI